MQSGPYASMPTIIKQPLGGAGPELAREWEESYQPLPALFLCLFFLWALLSVVWTVNTWMKRRWQSSNLQWALASVPLLKALVLGLSFIFWYSCLHLGTCSFWVAFGVFVSRVFFETVCFIAFLLIAHGYCLTHEQLSAPERRSIAGLASLLYLTLTGYKAAVPHFSILVVLVYSLLLYIIFLHAARNVGLLWEQLASMEDDDTHQIRSVLLTKYRMFRRYQSAMLLLVILETLIHVRAEGVASQYWRRLLVRECIEALIFGFMGWTFRSRKTSPFFSVIPTTPSGVPYRMPPIHRVEMDEREFKGLEFKQWQIGVPTSPAAAGSRPVLVIIQNPGWECPSPMAKPDPHSKTIMPAQGLCVKPVPLTGPVAEAAAIKDVRAVGNSSLGLIRPPPTKTPPVSIAGGDAHPAGNEKGWVIPLRVVPNKTGFGIASEAPVCGLANEMDGSDATWKSKSGQHALGGDVRSTHTSYRAPVDRYSLGMSIVKVQVESKLPARQYNGDGETTRRGGSQDVVVDVREGGMEGRITTENRRLDQKFEVRHS